MANDNSTQQSPAPSDGKASLSDVPDELLLDIIRSLNTVSQVCFALTSHQYLGLVLAAKGKKTLKRFVPDRYYTTTCIIRRRSGQDPTPKQELMRLLKSWMPLDHVSCSWRSDKYIKGGNKKKDSLVCSNCKRVDWDGLLRKIDAR